MSWAWALKAPDRWTIWRATGQSSRSPDDLSAYANHPIAFIFRYLRRRAVSHGAILAAVVIAVGCSVATQYGVKFLVDTLARGPQVDGIWLAFGFLVALIAADNLLWRVASWIASGAFTSVTGDLRRDLFRHLTGHAPSYFADRQPGMLTSRITATSNAVFTVENMFVWNVLPPCAATVAAISFVALVSLPMAGVLLVIGGIVVCVMFRLAAAGKPLHHDFRRPRRRRRRRDGRHHRQHAAGARLPRLPARAAAVPRDGRPRDDGAPGEPRLSREAAPAARRLDHRAHHRAARLGDLAVAAGRGDHRRRGAGVHPRACRCCTRRATSRSRWST